MMDAYIAKEAEAGLRAEALVTPPAVRRGILLGHRRGPRYFVSRVFPLGGRAFPGAVRLRELEVLFGMTIIGFYAARDPRPGPAGILRPFAYGKLFLRLAGTGTRRRPLAVETRVIDYDGRFRLLPIPLASGASRKPHGQFARLRGRDTAGEFEGDGVRDGTLGGGHE